MSIKAINVNKWLEFESFWLKTKMQFNQIKAKKLIPGPQNGWMRTFCVTRNVLKTVHLGRLFCLDVGGHSVQPVAYPSAHHSPSSGHGI